MNYDINTLKRAITLFMIYLFIYILDKIYG